MNFLEIMAEVCKNDCSQKYPIVLSCEKYNKIIKNLPKNVVLEDEDESYKNYLREGSKLMANWPESSKKDLEARELEKQTALEKKREYGMYNSVKIVLNSNQCSFRKKRVLEN